jgi:hypothetical protein
MKRETRNKLIRIINTKQGLINIILRSLRDMISLSEFNTIKNKIQSIDDNEYKKIKAIAISQLDKLDPIGRAARASASRRNKRGGRKRGRKTKKYQKGGNVDELIIISFGFLVGTSALATILIGTALCIKKSSDVVRNTGIFSRCFDECKTDREEQEDRRKRRAIRNKSWRELEIRRYRRNKKLEHKRLVNQIMNRSIPQGLKLTVPDSTGRTHLATVQVSYLKRPDGEDGVEEPRYKFTDVKTENLSNDERAAIERAKRKVEGAPDDYSEILDEAADSWEANTGTSLNLVEEGDLSDYEDEEASSQSLAYWNDWLKKKDERPYDPVPPMNSQKTRKRRSKSKRRD